MPLHVRLTLPQTLLLVRSGLLTGHAAVVAIAVRVGGGGGRGEEDQVGQDQRRREGRERAAGKWVRVAGWERLRITDRFLHNDGDRRRNSFYSRY